MNNLFSVIVAGGSGSRMKSVIAKQFLPLRNKPILSHTIEKFLAIDGNHVVVVLPKSDLIFWNEIIQSNKTLKQALLQGRIKNVIGGATRFQSVQNGLNAIESKVGLVAIHDGVRPFVSIEKIIEAFSEAEVKNSAVLAVPSKDSIRKENPDGSNEIMDRNEIKLIQTPQTFNLGLIKAAYEGIEKEHYTDDASVFEASGNNIHLMEGEYKNIKITTPEDLVWAEAFL
ncbi:MAG: 2-C-methyl-D-erythritol 4-phosphate cytidylyltransferase [Algoriphagus sp.]|jgi:2-C-methyl-D-erythritol 4-phosphate cytidylyltransferase